MARSHDTHHVNYLVIFVALCVLTLSSVAADLVKFENKAVLIVVVLGISTAKAMCVMAFFMHLKFEGNWKYLLLAPTAILAIGLPLALLPDIGLHYYLQTAPQGDVVIEEVAETHHPEEPAAPPENEK